MPDVYSQITAADPAVVAVLVNAMEVRAADPRLKAIRRDFISKIDFPEKARVLEVGCGSGPVCRELARWSNVGEVVGIDPSPIFLAKARELGSAIPNLSFIEGDARDLPLEDHSFDVVVFHTCLTHVPGPEKALAEALRVLRPGGLLAVFDGDYATATVATGDHDPLQDCVEAAVAALVHDRWLTRRLPLLAASAGFAVETFESYGYAQTSDADYMLTLVDRGADILAGQRRFDTALADGLKQAARRRVEAGAFFGFIAFAGLIARKPA